MALARAIALSSPQLVVSRSLDFWDSALHTSIVSQYPALVPSANRNCYLNSISIQEIEFSEFIELN